MNNYSFPSVSFQNTYLIPARMNPLARAINVNLSPNLTNVAFGTVMGEITASQSDVQTVTVTGTPTGGTFKLTGTDPWTLQTFTTATIAYNAAASAVASAVQAVLSTAATVAGTGGALPGTAVVLTFGGSLANRPVPLMTVTAAAFTGGSTPAATVAHTTVGATAGTFAPYSSAVVAAPSAAPTLTASGSGSTFVAGAVTVGYTYVTANGTTSPITYGESTLSPTAEVVLTSAQNVVVTSITGLNAAVTAVNFYVNGAFAAQQAVTAGATGTVTIAAPGATGGPPPRVNTAYTCPNGAGTQIAKGLLQYTCSTDANGYVSLATTPVGGEWGQSQLTAPLYYSGSFRIGDVTGLDATALDQLNGMVYVGSLGSGVGEFSFGA